MKQFGIILAVTCAGEIIKHFAPFPIPGSIYGLVLMLVLLSTKIIKLEQVKDTAEFLVAIMPMMFIPAGVGILTSWEQLEKMLLPVLVITVVTTIVVMVAAGKTTDFIMSMEMRSRSLKESPTELVEAKPSLKKQKGGMQNE